MSKKLFRWPIFSSWRCPFFLRTYLLLRVRPWGIVPDIVLYEVRRRSYIMNDASALRSEKRFFFAFRKYTPPLSKRRHWTRPFFPSEKGFLPHDLAWKRRWCKLSQNFQSTHFDCVVTNVRIYGEVITFDQQMTNRVIQNYGTSGRQFHFQYLVWL